MAVGTENEVSFRKDFGPCKRAHSHCASPAADASARVWCGRINSGTCQKCLTCRQLRLSLKNLFHITGCLPPFSLQMMESAATAPSVASPSTAQQEDKGRAQARYGKDVSIGGTVRVFIAPVDPHNFSPEPPRTRNAYDELFSPAPITSLFTICTSLCTEPYDSKNRSAVPRIERALWSEVARLC